LKDELGDLNEDEDQEEINYEDMAENIREIHSYLDPTRYPSEIEGLDKEKASEIVKDLHDKLM
jgi:hypothetical protein